MAAVMHGKVDQIILTGGIAYGKETVDAISEMVGWIAPITVYPGEDELLALAQGALRVLKGEEKRPGVPPPPSRGQQLINRENRNIPRLSPRDVFALTIARFPDILRISHIKKGERNHDAYHHAHYRRCPGPRRHCPGASSMWSRRRSGKSWAPSASSSTIPATSST